MQRISAEATVLLEAETQVALRTNVAMGS